MGTPVSSTPKTGRHDIAEILLKVALNTIKSINQTVIRYTKYFFNLIFPIFWPDYNQYSIFFFIAVLKPITIVLHLLDSHQTIFQCI